MDTEKQVNIIISAQDEAEAKIAALGGTIDELGATSESFGSSFMNSVGGAIDDGIAKIQQFGDIASIAIGVAAVGAVKSWVDSASQVQTTSTALEVLIGNTAQAQKLMNDLMNFSKSTPFLFGDITTAAQNLLAVNVPLADIQTNIKMLGDLSAGSSEKFKELVNIYGQVKNFGQLNGVDERRLAMDGIPMLQALTDYYNKNSQAVEANAASHAKAGVNVAKVTQELQLANLKLQEATQGHQASQTTLESLNKTITDYQTKIADADKKLQEYTTNHSINTAGIQKENENIQSYNASLEITKQKLAEAEAGKPASNSTILSLQDQIANYNAELGKASDATAGLGKQLTTQDVEKMLTNKQVSFDDFSAALQQMTDKGGKFYNMMEEHSTTFSGEMSTATDNFLQFGRELLGMQNDGEIKKGSIFDYLTQGLILFNGQTDKLDTVGKTMEAWKNDGVQYLQEFDAAVEKVWADIENNKDFKAFMKDPDTLKAAFITLGGVALVIMASIAYAVIAATWPFIVIIAIIFVLAELFMHWDQVSTWVWKNLGINLNEVTKILSVFGSLFLLLVKDIILPGAELIGGAMLKGTQIFFGNLGQMLNALADAYNSVAGVLNHIPGVHLGLAQHQTLFNSTLGNLTNTPDTLANDPFKTLNYNVPVPANYQNPNTTDSPTGNAANQTQITQYFNNNFGKAVDPAAIAQQLSFQMRYQ